MQLARKRPKPLQPKPLTRQWLTLTRLLTPLLTLLQPQPTLLQPQPTLLLRLLLRLLTLLLALLQTQPRLQTLLSRLLTRLVPLQTLPRRQPSDLLIHSENGKGAAQTAPFLYLLPVQAEWGAERTGRPGPVSREDSGI